MEGKDTIPERARARAEREAASPDEARRTLKWVLGTVGVLGGLAVIGGMLPGPEPEPEPVPVGEFVVGLVGLVVLVVVLGGLYFLPTVIAMNRKAKRSAGIALLNLFLGWTLIGWVGALIWAVSDNTTGHTHVRPGAGSRDPEPGRPAPRSAHPEPGRPTS